MKVESTVSGVHLTGAGGSISISDALQLVKDLLEACDATVAATAKEPDVSSESELSLDEIQRISSGMHALWQTEKGNSHADLAFLISGLATEVMKRGPEVGDRIRCSCGQIHRYCKIQK